MCCLCSPVPGACLRAAEPDWIHDVMLTLRPVPGWTLRPGEQGLGSLRPAPSARGSRGPSEGEGAAATSPLSPQVRALGRGLTRGHSCTAGGFSSLAYHRRPRRSKARLQQHGDRHAAPTTAVPTHLLFTELHTPPGCRWAGTDLTHVLGRCARSILWGQSLHTKDGSRYLQVVEIKEKFSPHTETLSSNPRQKEVRKCGF